MLGTTGDSLPLCAQQPVKKKILSTITHDRMASTAIATRKDSSSNFLRRLKDCRKAGPGVDGTVASKRYSKLAKAEGKGGLALRFHEDGLSRGSEEHV